MFSIFKLFKNSAPKNNPVPEEPAGLEPEERDDEKSWDVIELTDAQREALFPKTTTMISTLFDTRTPSQNSPVIAHALAGECEHHFPIV